MPYSANCQEGHETGKCGAGTNCADWKDCPLFLQLAVQSVYEIENITGIKILPDYSEDEKNEN